MRTLFSRCALLLAALALALPAGLLLATPAGATDNAAVDRFGACLAGQKAGDLLILFDESGSLTDSDPAAARVKAAQYLADTLARYADRTNAKLDVGIAGFSTEYTMRKDWSPLNGQTVDQVKAEIAPMAQHNTGLDTDYWQALDGARQALAGRTGGNPNRCQAIAWFTDGKIDFTQRPGGRDYAPGVDLDTAEGVAAMTAKATEEICRPGGMADQVRSSKIVMLAIGLGDDKTDVDFDVLSAIATGKGINGKACGKILDPVPGGFYPVSNIDDMLFAFDALNPDPKIEDTKGVCAQGEVCQEARHNFVLDRSVKSVSIVGSGGEPGIVPHLIAPSGQQVELPKSEGKSETTVDGMPVSYQWQSDSAQTITISSAGQPGWVGQWAIVYVDTTGEHPDALSRVIIHITTDIYPALVVDPKKSWRAGQLVKGVTFGLVDGQDKPIDPAGIAGSAALSVSVAADGAPPVIVLNAVPKDVIAKPVDIDLSGLRPGPAKVKMSLVITTAPALDPAGVQIAPGTQLTPQQVDKPIQLLPKLGLPVPGEQIDFGTVEGVKGATGTLSITGPGCVWIDGGATATVSAGPEDIGTLRLSSAADGPGNCLKVDDGQQGTLEVALNSERNGHGGLNGTVPLHIAPKDHPDEAETVDIAFTASMVNPLSTTNFILALLAALLLGPGIPVALLYLAKWYVGKIPGEPMLAERIGVTVDHGVLARDGEQFALAEDDLVSPVPGLAEGVRELTVLGVDLSVVTGRSPLGTAHVKVTAEGLVSAGSELPSTDDSGLAAVLPLAVHGKWLLLHNPAGPPDQAEILVMVPGTSDLAARQKLFEEIERKAPDMLAALRRRAEAANLVPVGAAAGEPASPFGGPPAPGPGFGGPDPFGGGGFGDPMPPPPMPPPPMPQRPMPPQRPGPPPGFNQPVPPPQVDHQADTMNAPIRRPGNQPPAPPPPAGRPNDPFDPFGGGS